MEQQVCKRFGGCSQVVVQTRQSKPRKSIQSGLHSLGYTASGRAGYTVRDTIARPAESSFCTIAWTTPS